MLMWRRLIVSGCRFILKFSGQKRWHVEQADRGLSGWDVFHISVSVTFYFSFILLNSSSGFILFFLLKSTSPACRWKTLSRFLKQQLSAASNRSNKTKQCFHWGLFSGADWYTFCALARVFGSGPLKMKRRGRVASGFLLWFIQLKDF